MASGIDRTLIAADALLLTSVLAVGALGERIPLPLGQDVLELPRGPAAGVPPPTPSIPEPAPPPKEPRPRKPAEPDPPPRAGEAEWRRVYSARQTGENFMAEARSARPTEPDKKRRAYAEAEKAFKTALTEIAGWRAALPPGAHPEIDEEERTIRMLIGECHKSSPMQLK